MDYTTYINILKDTLKKKTQLIDKLLEETLNQELALSQKEVDIDAFEEGVERKGYFIQQLAQLDDGFELIYERFGMEIKKNKLQYQGDILELQNYIKEVLDKSTLLQGKEKNNKEKFERYLAEKKVEVRKFKINNQAVGNYYRNMSDVYQGESIFLDKKK